MARLSLTLSLIPLLLGFKWSSAQNRGEWVAGGGLGFGMVVRVTEE